ncbi:MAG: hypothetical protein H6729_14950 [Deltaproteobacteria bacterium]|nr:hypothetical protein [Deltaproteobacteria bacterium]
MGGLIEKRATRTVAATLLVLGIGVSFAPPSMAAGKGGAPSARDDESVDALRKEVRSLRSALKALLAIDRERVEVLSRALDGVDDAPLDDARDSKSADEDGDDAAGKKTPRRKPRASTGTIVGKVEAPTNVAYVFVEDLRAPLVRGRKVVIEQLNKQYHPRWAVVRRGTEVEFPNRDAVYHNVFSKSEGNSFDLGIYRAGDPAKSVVLTAPGVVDVFCNMHPQMSASVLVVPNGYYTRVKANGTFRLNVPNGARRITAWAPFTEPETRSVVVDANEVSLSFKLTPRGMTHLNKHGQSYGSYE